MACGVYYSGSCCYSAIVTGMEWVFNMKKLEYTTVRVLNVDYKLLEKAKAMMERQPGVRHEMPLGWTIGTLAEYYLKRKGR